MAASRSSIALDALLKAGGETGKALEEAFHRTQLWNYRTGRQKPDADGVSKLHRLTKGGVPGDGWEDLPGDAPAVPLPSQGAA